MGSEGTTSTSAIRFTRQFVDQALQAHHYRYGSPPVAHRDSLYRLPAWARQLRAKWARIEHESIQSKS
jgi:hypothetical protein